MSFVFCFSNIFLVWQIFLVACPLKNENNIANLYNYLVRKKKKPMQRHQGILLNEIQSLHFKHIDLLHF